MPGSLGGWGRKGRVLVEHLSCGVGNGSKIGKLATVRSWRLWVEQKLSECSLPRTADL